MKLINTALAQFASELQSNRFFKILNLAYRRTVLPIHVRFCRFRTELLQCSIAVILGYPTMV
jgi:ABC-type arginine/histidine transport system permease subunit